MSARSDRKFVNLFIVVILLLHVVAIGLAVLSRIVYAHTQAQFIKEDEGMRRAVAERIAPFAKVAVAGADNSALEIAEDEGGAPQQQVELSGEETYKQVCAACHATGVAGAPKVGDAAEWAPRIARGIEVLRDHAINGYQGEKGLMPPKGGRPDLSDESVLAAVDYMLSQVQ